MRDLKNLAFHEQKSLSRLQWHTYTHMYVHRRIHTHICIHIHLTCRWKTTRSCSLSRSTGSRRSCCCPRKSTGSRRRAYSCTRNLPRKRKATGADVCHLCLLDVSVLCVCTSQDIGIMHFMQCLSTMIKSCICICASRVRHVSCDMEVSQDARSQRDSCVTCMYKRVQPFMYMYISILYRHNFA